MHRSPLLVLGLVAALASSPLAAPSSSRGTQSVSLLDRYAAKDFASVERELAAVPHDQLPDIGKRLQRESVAWIRSAGPAAAPHRRLVAASLGLEIVATGVETEWTAVRDLIEFGCELIRHDPATPAARAWFIASIALGQGGYDDTLLDRHIKHADNAFPNDDVIALSRAVAIETIPSKTETVPTPDGQLPVNAFVIDQRAVFASSIQNLSRFRQRPLVAAEAEVRIGYLYFAMQRGSEALPHFAAARTHAIDDYWLYLSHYLEARALQQLGRHGEAFSAYERAWQVIPAQSAGEALALRYAIGDEPIRAIDIARQTLDRAAAPIDPFRYYGYGMYRQWTTLRNSLRKEMLP